ncbi:MAG: DHH family phosphoesterase, partial [Candidatus Diapherotrites archaeon]|nr:DHH family phosphoesterase [Candidatus Diapherotrites archaeon]
IIDHHQPVDLNYPNQLNPFTFGFDGGSEISGAGMCYFFALALDEKNYDMAYLALIGALGDMQDSKGGIKGLNEKIVQTALEHNQISITKDLRLYGRFTRPLVPYLQFSGNPAIPGISANENGCIELLRDLNIPLQTKEKWRVYNDLDEEEKKRLISALIVRLVEASAPDWEIKLIFGDVYTRLSEEGEFLQDLKEFGTMLNAVGRHGEAEIGVEICLGNRGTKYHYAISKVKEHREALATSIDWLSRGNLHEEELYYWFDAKSMIESTIVGIVAGMVLGSEIAQEHKAIFGFAKEDEFVKVSARATWRLVNKGLNLGKLMHEACDKIGNESEGGGHAIAAGARIPKDSEKKFLEIANEIIKKQTAQP